MNFTESALALASALCSTAGQISFKAAALRLRPRAILFWGIGAALMFASVIAAVLALRTAPLSGLIPFAGLVYITTPLAARIVFKETVRPQFWLGTLFIVIGVLLTLKSTG